MPAALKSTTKIVLWAAICCWPFFASAIGGIKVLPPPPEFEWGDWGSSGTIPDIGMWTVDVEPERAISYSCQMQLTDQIDRKDSFGKTYWSVGVAEFNFNEGVRFIRSEELSWYHKNIYRNEGVALDSESRLPFKTTNQSARIRFSSQDSEMMLVLTLDVSQLIGTIRVLDSESKVFSLLDSKIELHKSLNLQTQEGLSRPSHLLRVLCDKKI